MKGTYDQVKDKWVCSECGKECANQGGLNLHWKKKHGNSSSSGSSSGKDGGGHKHNWQLLNDAIPAQQRAMAAGYIKVCKECGELA